MTHRLTWGRFSASFTALAVGLIVPTIAGAQEASQSPGSVEARIEALEARLRQTQTELEQLRQATRAAVPTPAPAPAVSARLPVTSTTEICRMRGLDDLDASFREPRNLRECVPIAPTEAQIASSGANQPAGAPTLAGPSMTRSALQDQVIGARTGDAAEAARSVSQPLPDRPLITPGLSTTLEFSGTTRLSVDYAHPVILRSVSAPDGRFAWFRPQLLTIRGGVSVAQDRNENIFISDKFRSDRADLDFLSGTTVRFGVDFLSFRRFDRRASFLRTTNVLYQAYTACRTANPTVLEMTQAQFLARYGFKRARSGRWELTESRATTIPNGRCSEADLVAFVFETERNPDNTEEVRFKRPQLVAAYQASFWTEDPQAIPDWGAGASVEYGSSDFAYRQGVINLVPGSSDPALRPQLDPTVALASPRTDSEDSWKIRGYVSYFLPLRDRDALPTSRVYNPGVMLIASATYSTSAEFRPGTTGLTICPQPTAGAFTQCQVVNVDRPYTTDGITLSAEVRTQWNNVPVLGVFGIAPRYSNRLEDNRQSIEVPIYLSRNTSGWGAAGFRVRHQWNGRDIFGNDERPASDISVFISPALSFRAF